ncbi:MAG: hypothetical protein ACYDH5_06055 [Acidimicrobiales bacterium]
MREVRSPRRWEVAVVLKGRLAGLLALVIGLLHLALAPKALHIVTWLGALFLIGGIALLACAAVLLARPASSAAQPAWGIAGLVAAGMFVGGAASRTVGLLGLHFPWSPIIVVALVLEAVLLALWAASGFGRSASRARR